jgi:hypothetical protein
MRKEDVHASATTARRARAAVDCAGTHSPAHVPHHATASLAGRQASPPSGCGRDLAVALGKARAVAHQATGAGVAAFTVTRGDGVARSQGQKLVALAGEERIGGHNQRIAPVAHRLQGPKARRR